jgi:hypothetical protein
VGKVIFLTFSRSGLGFWIRYTSSHLYSSPWLSVFRESGPVGFRKRLPPSEFRIRGFDVTLGESSFSMTNGAAVGRFGEFSWDLRIRSIEGPRNALPPLARLVSRSRYLLLTPLGVFDGEVRLGNDRITIKDHVGMVGYISSPRELDEWAWAHCSGFDEDPMGWLDLLVTKMGGGYIALGLVRLRGRLMRLGGALGSVFRGRLGLGGINWSSRLGGYPMELSVNADTNRMILAEYEDPRGPRYCHNTEVGDMKLTLGGEEFACLGRAFFEYGAPSPLDVVGRVVVVDG